MLWNAATVQGFEVQGTDQAAGRVADLLLGAPWTVRALLLGDGQTLPIAQLSKLDGPGQRVLLKLPAAEVAAVAADPAELAATPRRLGALFGLGLQATDGPVGPVRDVLFQDSDWTIKFLTADGADGTSRVLISTEAVSDVDWAAGLVRLTLDRKAVAASPVFEGDLAVDGAGADDHKARRSYFGVELVPPETPPGVPELPTPSLRTE